MSGWAWDDVTVSGRLLTCLVQLQYKYWTGEGIFTQAFRDTSCFRAQGAGKLSDSYAPEMYYYI